LTNRIPQRVEVSGLENVEAWLNTLDVGVAMLAGDAIKFGPPSEREGPRPQVLAR
jgi:hypothetical protein